MFRKDKQLHNVLFPKIVAKTIQTRSSALQINITTLFKDQKCNRIQKKKQSNLVSFVYLGLVVTVMQYLTISRERQIDRKYPVCVSIKN